MSFNCLHAVPAVNVDVAIFQTSAAREPKLESVLVFALPQTAVGMVANNEDEAVSTVALVLLLIVVIADVN